MAIGDTSPSARKSGELGTGGEAAMPGMAEPMPGAPGASAVSPAKDAAMARKSVSVNGPGGDGGGEADMLGGAPIPGDSRNEYTGISSGSGSCGAAALSARSFGIARKNSFASRSITAGSGSGIAPNGYFGALDLDPFAPAPLLVLVVLVDMDVL
jgi:hypothetical protein